MQSYGTPDLIGAWIITQLWAHKPGRLIRLEMASAALPVRMDERSFATGRQMLVAVGLIDRMGKLTALGREAKAFPGPGAPSYRERFKEAFAQLRPTGQEAAAAERARLDLITEFADFIYLAEVARRRLASL